jgi:hypothetical protein
VSDPLRAQDPAGSVPVRALFLHIQKTAGTSLIEAVRPRYGQSLVSHGDCWGRTPASLADVGFVSGHIGYDFARHLMPSRFSFTFLRDPAERILSMYYFCRSRDPARFMIYRRAHELDLADFLRAGFHDPWVRKNIWNNQVWQLAHGYGHLDDRSIDDFSETELLALAMRHLDELSFVGFTESFPADQRTVLSALGLPPGAERSTLRNRTPRRPGAGDLSPQIRTLLADLTILDRQFCDYARTRVRVARNSTQGACA